MANPNDPPREEKIAASKANGTDSRRLWALLDIETSWSYILVAIVIYMIATGLHIYETTHNDEAAKHWGEQLLECAAHFARDMAIAIVVGLYLRGTLEKQRAHEVSEEFAEQKDFFENRAKKQEESFAEQTKKLGENILEVVYESRHQRKLFDAVKESIFTQPFYRSECRNVLKLIDLCEGRHYGLREFQQKLVPFVERSREEGKQHVVVWFQSRYRVHNTAEGKASYKVQFHVDRFSLADRECTDCISQIRVNSKPLLLTPIFGGVAHEKNHSKNPSVLSFCEELDIPGGGYISVDIEAYTVRPAEWTETWGWLSPSDELEIVIEDPDGNKVVFVEMTAHLSPGTPDQMQKKPSDPTLVYSIPDFLLPYNYFTVKWFPEPTAAQVDPCKEGCESTPAAPAAQVVQTEHRPGSKILEG